MMIPFDYLVQKYGIKTDGVLHLGASTGQEADAYKTYGINKMIFVEAIPEVYEDLKKHIKAYPQAIAINECLSDTDGNTVTFNISDNEAQSSSFLELGYHKTIHPSVHYVKKIQLVTKTVQTIIRENNIDLTGIELLNVDLQGSELMALMGMNDLLRNFKYAIIEVNKRETYVGCALVEEIDAYLKQYDFERVETGTWVGDTWTDAFYLRR